MTNIKESVVDQSNDAFIYGVVTLAIVWIVLVSYSSVFCR